MSEFRESGKGSCSAHKGHAESQSRSLCQSHFLTATDTCGARARNAPGAGRSKALDEGKVSQAWAVG
jgi:hypothetical protein